MPNLKKTPPAAKQPYLPAVTDAEERFRKLGFTEVPKPVAEMPVMPGSLSGLSGIELGNWQSKYAQWREYTQDRLISATKEVTMAIESYNRAYSFALRAIKIKANVTEKKLIAENDPDVQQKQVALTDAESLRDMLSDKVKAFDDCLAVISREITLRSAK